MPITHEWKSKMNTINCKQVVVTMVRNCGEQQIHHLGNPTPPLSCFQEFMNTWTRTLQNWQNLGINLRKQSRRISQTIMQVFIMKFNVRIFEHASHVFVMKTPTLVNISQDIRILHIANQLYYCMQTWSFSGENQGIFQWNIK